MSWLNDNQGALIALLTVLLVVINVIYCIINYRQFKLLKMQWMKTLQPQLAISLVKKYGQLYFKVINVSDSPAFNCRFILGDKMKEVKPGFPNAVKFLDLEKSGIGIAQRELIYIPTFYSYLQLKEIPVQLTCIYEDINGMEYKKRYNFDLKAHDLISYQNQYQLDYMNNVERIAKNINAIVSLLKSCVKSDDNYE